MIKFIINTLSNLTNRMELQDDNKASPHINNVPGIDKSA
jgi:hypothetical protein